MDFWQVIPVAVALVFVLEGLLPFISPGRWRAVLEAARELDDRTIRAIGLGSMLTGLTMLYLFN